MDFLDERFQASTRLFWPQVDPFFLSGQDEFMQIFGQYKTFWLRVFWTGHDQVKGFFASTGLFGTILRLIWLVV